MPTEQKCGGARDQDLSSKLRMEAAYDSDSKSPLLIRFRPHVREKRERGVRERFPHFKQVRSAQWKDLSMRTYEFSMSNTTRRASFELSCERGKREKESDEQCSTGFGYSKIIWICSKQVGWIITCKYIVCEAQFNKQQDDEKSFHLFFHEHNEK